VKLILLDRGDRKPLTDWVKDRFKDYDIICPNFEPLTSDKDIVARLRIGVAEARDEDFVYILENDDYYPFDYIERMEKIRKKAKAHWIGDYSPWYYSIRTKTYQQFHMKVSGLWCMGFHPGIMEHIKWLDDAHLSMDGWISKGAARLPWATTVLYSGHGGVGIKGHGYGMPGSVSHKETFRNRDSNIRWLVNHTDESFVNLHYG